MKLTWYKLLWKNSFSIKIYISCGMIVMTTDTFVWEQKHLWCRNLVLSTAESSALNPIKSQISISILFHSANSVIISVQFSSVTQSCLTLCDPMNRSTPGLPVHHQLPESTQTHVHQVGDAIQPSQITLSPSPPALNLSQHQGLFKWVSSLHQVAKVFQFQLQHQSFQWTLRTDLLQNGLVGSPCSPRDSQESSPTPQFKSINSSALSFLHSPTLASIHDHWKNHSLD